MNKSIVGIVLFSVVLCGGELTSRSLVKESNTGFDLLKEKGVSEKITSVEKLIEMSVGYHPALKSSKASVQGAQAQVDSALWGYFPTPSVDFSQSRTNRSITFRLDQPLWTGGRISGNYDLAVSRKNESLFGFSENEYALIDNVLSTLQSYLQAQGSVFVLTQGRKELVAFKELLARRVDAGVSSLGDQELVLSRLAQMEADLSSAKIKKTTALSQMKVLVGAPIECVIALDETKIPSVALPFEEMVEALLRTHPTVKKYQAQIESARAEKEIAKSVLWPTLTARAEHQNGSVYTDTASNVNNVGYLVLQMQPGAGFSSYSNIQSAEAKVMQAQFQFDAKKHDLVTNVLRIYNENYSANSRLKAVQESIDAAQNVLDSNMRLFVAGKKQWLDVVNSSRELTQVKGALSDLEVSRFITAYQLVLQQGLMKYSEAAH